MSNAYQYTTLVEPHAFRLILLRPSPNLTSPLKLGLITSTFSQYDDDIVDHYIAFSYVWGDQADTRTVDIQGKELEITASLESALRHLRDGSREMKIWADGICINQKNKEVKYPGPPGGINLWACEVDDHFLG